MYVDREESALVRLRLAADLARRHGSRLTVLYVREWSPAQLDERKTAELGLASAKELDRLDQLIEASIDEAAERLRSALETFKAEHGLEAEWRCLNGVASVVVPQHARYADLCVLGQDTAAGTDSIGYSFSEQLLFVTGRPVLFIPAFGVFKTLGRHISPVKKSRFDQATSDATAMISAAPSASNTATLMTVIASAV